uniref:EO4 n=1 Tax=Swordtail adomavirus 2 TaxID=2609877 RepID=A0A6F9F5P4_9VIRU|nr:TPA_asm: EO4 [Swordtail adomavirus 2]
MFSAALILLAFIAIVCCCLCIASICIICLYVTLAQPALLTISVLCLSGCILCFIISVYLFYKYRRIKRARCTRCTYLLNQLREEQELFSSNITTLVSFMNTYMSHNQAVPVYRERTSQRNSHRGGSPPRYCVMSPIRPARHATTHL